MPTKLLQLVAVGNPPLLLLRELEQPLMAQLGLASVVSKTQLGSPAYAFNKDRNQYHSNAIMRRLVPLLEPGHSCVLGVSDVDLFVPDSPFVLGEADRESKIALLSVARLRAGADPETFRRRLHVEAVHQAGRLLGLASCEDVRCVMFTAQTVQDCDRKNLALCNLCRNEFAKLNKG